MTNVKSKDENSEKKRKSGDILLKIMSVIFAALIWFFVIGVESPITEKKFPGVTIETRNMPSLTERGLSIISASSSSSSSSSFVCDVVLSGKKSDINKLKSSDIKAYVDLEEVSAAGSNTLMIYIEDMGSITMMELSPSNLLLNIDKSIKRQIPLVAEVTQSMSEAKVKIGDPIPDKDFVMVTGPEADIKKIDHAKVDLKLGDKNIDKPMKVKEKIVLVDENGEEIKSSYIKTDITDVECYIPVTMEKEIPLTVNYKYGYYNEKNTKITINPQTITIEGTPDFLNTIEEIQLGTIDEKTIESDTAIKFNIATPEGTLNKSGTGVADVEIRFIDSDTKTITLTKEDIKVISPSGFEYVILTEEITVNFRGSALSLYYLSKSRVSASIDLSKKTEKGVIYSVPVIISTLNDTAIFSYGEYTVSVEIY